MNFSGEKGRGKSKEFSAEKGRIHGPLSLSYRLMKPAGSQTRISLEFVNKLGRGKSREF